VGGGPGRRTRQLPAFGEEEVHDVRGESLQPEHLQRRPAGDQHVGRRHRRGGEQRDPAHLLAGELARRGDVDGAMGPLPALGAEAVADGLGGEVPERLLAAEHVLLHEQQERELVGGVEVDVAHLLNARHSAGAGHQSTSACG